jgi:hypothetical protein
MKYLQRHQFTNGAQTALQEFIKRRRELGDEIDWDGPFGRLAQHESEGERWDSSFDVYDVGPSGIAHRLEVGSPYPDDGDAPIAFDMIKNVNYPTGKAVGRIM